MPGPPSAQVLPRSVNPRKFAFQDTRITGKVMSANLQRLNEAVVRVHDAVQVELHFHPDGNGKPIVEGKAEVTVSMTCQRCLAEVTQNLAVTILLAIVITDEQSRQLPKDIDPWLVESEDGSADLHAMVEEELLLALPMVALHQEFCIDESLLHSQGAEIAKANQEKTDNPFKVLEQLQTKKPNLD